MPSRLGPDLRVAVVPQPGRFIAAATGHVWHHAARSLAGVPAGVIHGRKEHIARRPVVGDGSDAHGLQPVLSFAVDDGVGIATARGGHDVVGGVHRECLTQRRAFDRVGRASECRLERRIDGPDNRWIAGEKDDRIGTGRKQVRRLWGRSILVVGHLDRHCLPTRCGGLVDGQQPGKGPESTTDGDAHTGGESWVHLKIDKTRTDPSEDGHHECASGNRPEQPRHLSAPARDGHDQPQTCDAAAAFHWSDHEQESKDCRRDPVAHLDTSDRSKHRLVPTWGNRVKPICRFGGGCRKGNEATRPRFFHVAATRTPVVLVVDDEESVADTYALRLGDGYETRVAYGGEEALEKIGDDVDAVLLDRRMPDIHGDDVLDEIRDRGYDCAVIMTTAVDPDLNILEMDFDDYLCKPIYQETLVDTLEQHVDPQEDEQRDPRLSEFFSLVSKISVLREEKSRAELANSDEFNRLKTRAEELGGELRDSIDNFEEIVETHREIERGS